MTLATDTTALYQARATLAKLTPDERRRRWGRDGVGATRITERRYTDDDGVYLSGGLLQRAGFSATVTIDGHRIELGVFATERTALSVSGEARRRIVGRGADALTETFAADCRAAVGAMSHGDHVRTRSAVR